VLAVLPLALVVACWLVLLVPAAGASPASTSHPIAGGGGGTGVVVLATDPGFAAAGGGYNGTAAQIDNGGYGWSSSRYWAYGTAYGTNQRHNCTTYAAFRLQYNAFPYPGWTADATGWATQAWAHGTNVDQTPAVGSIAQWNLGHVAYVEQVLPDGIVTTSDSWGGGTDHLKIATTSPRWPDNFIHFKDIGWPPADGSFVQVSGTATIYRIAGGAPLGVSSWAPFGGPQPVTVISQAQFNTLLPVPRDGTFIYTPDTSTYVIAGGAPIVITNWAAVGGPHAAVLVDPYDLQNLTDPAVHMNPVPADGTFIYTPDTSTYVIAGGAPIVITKWAAVGGPHAAVLVDPWVLANITNPQTHLRAVPADGTFLCTSTGHVYRIAGGTPIAVSAWSVFGGVQPYVTIDPWDIDHLGVAAAHLNAKPSNGTLVKGLPSGLFWSFASGCRCPAAASAAAIGEDDLGLAAFPLATTPTPTPTPTLTPTCTLHLIGLQSGTVRLGKSVTAKGVVTPTSLAGSRVTLTVQLKKGAKWVKAKTFSALITSSDTYSWKFKPVKRGAYRLQVAITATATHTAAMTPWLVFRVR